jgi:D-3-phosphoglycerate dehydrogenase
MAKRLACRSFGGAPRRDARAPARRADGKTVARSREAFFAGADVVSVHVRMNASTAGLITPADLAAMKPSAVFVNTSRAGLVAPGVLLAALNAGRPGMAAVDVLEVEPLHDAGDPFINHPNVIAPPHVGYVTEDELEIQFADIFDQINAYAAGDPIHMVDPEVWRG